MTSDQSQPSSLRALARRLRCGHSALSKAVREKRLVAGVRIVNGKIVVFDATAAEAQWRDIHVVRIDEAVQREAADSVAIAPKSNTGDQREQDRDTKQGSPLLDARTRREQIRVELEEMELGKLRSEYVCVATVRHDLFAMFTQIRNAFLGLPSRLAQRLPHGKRDLEVINMVDELVRETLEALADEEADRLIERNRTGRGEL